MFTWDDSTPTTLCASPTNQQRVSLDVRATTLSQIDILTKSSVELVQIKELHLEWEEKQKRDCLLRVPMNL